MRQVLLIRHSISRPEPGMLQGEWGLTDEGKARCGTLAEHLWPYALQQIFSSHRKRARETAALTAAALDIPWAVREGFEEQGGEAVPWIEDYQEFLALVERLLSYPEEAVFGSETGRQGQKRFSQAVTRLLHEFPIGNLAIVTHGRILTLFLARHTDIEPVQFWRTLTMPCFVSLTYDGQHLLTRDPAVQHL